MTTAHARALGQLHAAPCPVPMWESVGRHYGHPRPACTCGADERQDGWAIPKTHAPFQTSYHWFTDGASICGKHSSRLGYERDYRGRLVRSGVGDAIGCCKACLRKLEALRRKADRP